MNVVPQRRVYLAVVAARAREEALVQKCVADRGLELWEVSSRGCSGRILTFTC